jgi:uncharacterized membrane protein (DUF485 family)
MSYTVVNQGPKPRPGVVSAASALLYAAAAIQLVSIVLSLISLGPVRDVLDDEFADLPDAEVVGTAVTVGIFIGVGVSVLLAVASAVLGALVGRGRNPARIVAWVFAGIAVLCYGCNAIGAAAGNALTGSFGQTNPETEEIERRLQEAIPAWQESATMVITVVLLLMYIAVIVLLALPASNEFFRRETEVWVPPTGPMGGPGDFPPPAPPPQQ